MTKGRIHTSACGPHGGLCHWLCTVQLIIFWKGERLAPSPPYHLFYICMCISVTSSHFVCCLIAALARGHSSTAALWRFLALLREARLSTWPPGSSGAAPWASECLMPTITLMLCSVRLPSKACH